MRHGIYLPTEGAFADVALLVSLARSAEVEGWDGVFLWDELFPVLDADAPVVDTYVALSAIAAATEHVRLGAVVTPVARLRPEAFAKQTATLDHLAGGRLTLGVGLGYPATQFTAFGGAEDAGERAAMVDEFLELVTLLWTGHPVDFDGEHYTATRAGLRPTPVQQPRIPIWIAGDVDHRAPRRRAARWDGFVPASTSWPDGVIAPGKFEAMLRDIEPRGAYDVVAIGSASDPELVPSQLDAYAAAGVTWVLHQALDVAALRAMVHNGPPDGS